MNKARYIVLGALTVCFLSVTQTFGAPPPPTHSMPDAGSSAALLALSIAGVSAVRALVSKK